MFVDLVDGGVDKAEFYQLAADSFDKASVGCAACGGKLGGDAANALAGALAIWVSVPASVRNGLPDSCQSRL